MLPAVRHAVTRPAPVRDADHCEVSPGRSRLKDILSTRSSEMIAMPQDANTTPPGLAIPFAVAMGAGLGLILGLVLGGRDGIALGLAFGAAAGVVLGAVYSVMTTRR